MRIHKLIQESRFFDMYIFNISNNSLFIKLVAFAFSLKSFAIAILVFFYFFYFFCFFFFSFSSLFLDGPPKGCDQDLTHSLYTLKCFSVNIVPQVVIRDTCSTRHRLCTVTRIQSIQKGTRNSPLETRKQGSQWIAEDLKIKQR